MLDCSSFSWCGSNKVEVQSFPVFKQKKSNKASEFHPYYYLAIKGGKAFVSYLQIPASELLL